MNKRSILAVGLSSLLLISCGANNQNKNQDNPSSDNKEASLGDAVKAVGSLKKMADHADDMEKVQKKLSKMKPVSHETLKKVLPETLMGLKRTKYSVSSNKMFGNLLTGEATYGKDNDHDIELSIIDGAGEAGSGVVMLAMLGLQADMEKETESGFTKTVEKAGQHLKVEQNKEGDDTDSKITTVIDNRFLVTLEGNNYVADELEKAYDELDFSALNK